MFGQFTIHAGDFKPGNGHQVTGGNLFLKSKGRLLREKIPTSRIVDIEEASTESVKRFGGTVGWGIAGAALLGPVGLLAGLLAGGRGTDITFVCQLSDGRKFLATAPSKVYRELSSSTF